MPAEAPPEHGLRRLAAGLPDGLDGRRADERAHVLGDDEGEATLLLGPQVPPCAPCQLSVRVCKGDCDHGALSVALGWEWKMGSNSKEPLKKQTVSIHTWILEAAALRASHSGPCARTSECANMDSTFRLVACVHRLGSFCMAGLWNCRDTRYA